MTQMLFHLPPSSSGSPKAHWNVLTSPNWRRVPNRPRNSPPVHWPTRPTRPDLSQCVKLQHRHQKDMDMHPLLMPKNPNSPDGQRRPVSAKCAMRNPVKKKNSRQQPLKNRSSRTAAPSQEQQHVQYLQDRENPSSQTKSTSDQDIDIGEDFPDEGNDESQQEEQTGLCKQQGTPCSPLMVGVPTFSPITSLF